MVKTTSNLGISSHDNGILCEKMPTKILDVDEARLADGLNVS